MITPPRRRSKRPLPPLEAGQAYQAVDFQYFEFEGERLTGTQPTLTLHLKNTTSIDLPVTREQLEKLLAVLMAAYPQHARKIYEQYFSGRS